MFKNNQSSNTNKCFRLRAALIFLSLLALLLVHAAFAPNPPTIIAFSPQNGTFVDPFWQETLPSVRIDFSTSMNTNSVQESIFSRREVYPDGSMIPEIDGSINDMLVWFGPSGVIPNNFLVTWSSGDTVLEIAFKGGIQSPTGNMLRPDGKYTLTITDNRAGDQAGNPLLIPPEHQIITFYVPGYGNVDLSSQEDSEYVDLADAEYFMRHILAFAGYNIFALFDNYTLTEELAIEISDVDDSGISDFMDAVYIIRHVLDFPGYDEFPSEPQPFLGTPTWKGKDSTHHLNLDGALAPALRVAQADDIVVSIGELETPGDWASVKPIVIDITAGITKKEVPINICNLNGREIDTAEIRIQVLDPTVAFVKDVRPGDIVPAGWMLYTNTIGDTYIIGLVAVGSDAIQDDEIILYVTFEAKTDNPIATTPVNLIKAKLQDTVPGVPSTTLPVETLPNDIILSNDVIFEKVSGDNQSGPIGSVLPNPLVVRVLDQDSNPMEGVTVDFEPSKGASVNPTQATTDENGLAQTMLTLGMQPGEYTVTASVEGVDPVVFTATATDDVKADVINLVDAEGMPSEEVRIPLYIQDVSGTPLDADNPGNEIAAWSIQFATNENYEIMDVERAGITENMEPAYGQFIKATNTWSLIYNTGAGNPPPNFTLNKASPGDLVGNLVVNIADMEITEDLVVSVEMTQSATLSNEGGTVGESVSNRTLQLVNGELTIIASICGDTNGDRNGPDFLDVVYLFNYVVGGGPPPEPLRAGNVNGIGGVDFLDVVYLFNHVVAGGPEPTCSEITTFVTAGSTPKAGTTKDFLTLGEITARAGETIRLPFYLQDVSGTPLDADDAGNKIATWMIAFSTNEKYEIIDVQRAGVTENLEPAYGQFVKSTNTWSLIYNTAAGNPPPEFTLDKPSPGDLIGELVIKLDENAEGDLSVEISAATLSNEAGTVGEFLANNTLGVVAGIIHRILPGDVSGDKNVTAYDASLVLQYVVGLIEHLPNEQAADVTEDETISALDAALILQYTVGLITSFPVDSAPVAPALNPPNEIELLTKAIEQLESISLTKEPKQVLEQLKNLISKQLLPKHTALLQNYPNPFNPDTWIPFRLAQSAPVTINIYDTKGQLLRTLHIGNKEAGIYTTKDQAAYWDGMDYFGQRVSSGIYYYTLQAGTFKATRKMLILK